MNPTRSFSLWLFAALGCAVSISAQVIAPATVASVSLQFNNTHSVSNVGISAEGAVWSSASNVWWVGYKTSLTLNLGVTYRGEDVLTSIDHPERPAVGYSLDKFHFTNLSTILPSYGEIPVSPASPDPVSADAISSEYVFQTDFSPVLTRYLRVPMI